MGRAGIDEHLHVLEFASVCIADANRGLEGPHYYSPRTLLFQSTKISLQGQRDTVQYDTEAGDEAAALILPRLIPSWP